MLLKLGGNLELTASMTDVGPNHISHRKKKPHKIFNTHNRISSDELAHQTVPLSAAMLGN